MYTHILFFFSSTKRRWLGQLNLRVHTFYFWIFFLFPISSCICLRSLVKKSLFLPKLYIACFSTMVFLSIFIFCVSDGCLTMMLRSTLQGGIRRQIHLSSPLLKGITSDHLDLVDFRILISNTQGTSWNPLAIFSLDILLYVVDLSTLRTMYDFK